MQQLSSSEDAYKLTVYWKYTFGNGDSCDTNTKGSMHMLLLNFD